MAPNQSRSKLIDKLRQVSRGPVARIGFGRPAGARLPALVLVVSLGRNDADLAEAAIKAGADALLLHLNEELPEVGTRFGDLDAEKEALQRVASTVGGIPWGVKLGEQGALSSKDFAHLAVLGADFVSASAATAPIALLSAEGLGRIVSVDRSLSPYLIRTINDLPIDAVEVSVLDEAQLPGELSILDVMKYRQMVDLIRLPIIAHTQGRLKPEDVPALRQVGLEGLIVDVNTVGADRQALEEITRAFRQAIDQAGAPLGRGRPAGAILPQVQPAAGVHELEPEEPEEDW